MVVKSTMEQALPPIEVLCARTAISSVFIILFLLGAIIFAMDEVAAWLYLPFFTVLLIVVALCLSVLLMDGMKQCKRPDR